MADGSLPIVVTPEAFGRGAFDLTVVEGLTVRAMLVEAVRSGLPIEALRRTEIYVAGARLDRQTALDHVLTADQVVNVVVEPMGGGGGRKDIGQILLTVAVIAVSAWVGGGAATPAGFFDKLLVRTALAGAVGLAGQALIGALYGPGGGPAKANDRYALQSASNQYRQWGPMPLALGEVVTAPDLAAKTFTQSQGDDVWMYGILGLHYGPCEVAEVRIGDTLVSTMGAGDFRMVQHLEPGPRTFQLYPNDVDQLDLNEELKATPSSATPLVRAASSDGSRFDLDFFLPAGLYFQKDDGRVLTAHASVAVRYRPIDQTGVATGPWQSAPSWARTSATKDPIRVTHSVHLPHGRYEFELTRNRPDDGNDKRRDTIMVSAIKSVAFRKPITDETLSIIEFAVRATAINQGGLAPITCRIKPKCSTWTGGAWGAPVATSNPAALARWLLTGPAPAKPLLPAQADARLRVWHQLCEQYDWKCHLYLTEARTQSEALAILERAGRAGVFWDGTQLAASPWVEKPIPAQVFTDDNLKDHRWEIVYPDPVHALRVEFQNIEKGGEPDELFVYNDGYGEVADPANGIKAASLIEALTLDGQATPNRAYRDGRWKLGQRRHQRRIDTWTADVEHLISHYGSRVRLAWNRAGGGSARVRCRRWSEDGSAVVGLRLSAPVEMFAGVSYAVDLRTKGGLYDGVPIQTQPGVTREILFASARAPSVCPAAGDLIAFGEVEKVSEDVEIIAIEPGENLTAVLTGVRYVAPLLMAGETGPIPPLTSKLSGDRQANPPRPTLLGVQADAHGVRISFGMPTWKGAPLSGFAVRWRSKTADGEAGAWGALPALDAAARDLRTPPLREAPGEDENATRAEVEITATTVDGRASKPLTLTISLPVPARPAAWAVEPKGAAADGSSQPILVVTGQVDDPDVAAVKIAWGLTATGPWKDVYQGAPSLKGLEITGLTADVDHYVAITYLSAQGLPGEFLVIGPRVPSEYLAGGLAPNAAQKLLDDALKGVDDKVKEAAEEIEKSINLDDVFNGQGDLAEAILKLGRGQSELQRIIETHTREGGVLVKSIVKVMGGELENAQGAIVEEARLSLERDRAEALLREALALQVDHNEIVFQSSISGLVTDLAAEVRARQDLGARVANAEGAIVNEATIRANQDGVWLQNFNLLGGRRGNGSGWVLNKATVDITDEGTLAQVLSGLRAVDGANSSAITTLSQASANQASQLLTLSNTVGGQTASISQLFQVMEGIGARWTVALDSNGTSTGLVADGQTRSWVFSGASLSIIDAGNGLSYVPATGRLKIVKGNKKTVLGAGNDLIVWAGNTSVADGAETVDNGDFGIGSGDAWFGGRTLSRPFDSGTGPDTPIVIPADTWTVIAETTLHRMREGVFMTAVSLDALVASSTSEGAISWVVESVNASGGDPVIVAQSGFNMTANIIPWTTGWSQYIPGLGRRSGLRRLRLSVAWRNPPTTGVTIRRARLWGLYTADVTSWP